MAKAKPSGIQALAEFPLHSLLLHPLVLFLAVTIGIIIAAIGLWKDNKQQILKPADFQLSWDRLQVNPPPPWIVSDPKRNAFDGSQLSDVSLLEVDALPKVAAAFGVQPWVANVSARKSPSGIRVHVDYRRPVALVEFGKNLLLPVDRLGIVLDGREFNETFADQFLRLSVDSPFSKTLVHGETWPDDRVVAGALIAAAIQDHAASWGIVRIRHLPLHPGSLDPAGEFELLTARGLNGIRVRWGSPPGYEAPGESNAEMKIKLLDEWTQQRGPLSEIGTTQTIDVRFEVNHLAATAPAGEQ